MERKELAPKLVETAAEMSGGVLGAAVGVSLAGPAGAIAGGAVGPLIAKCLNALGQEVHSRMLGPREIHRIDVTLRTADKLIGDRISQGENVRTDGFFDSLNGNRSAGEEVGEGVLRAAQKEYEERKIPFLAALIASISFDTNVGREQANMLIRLFERLSYRQVRLLAFFGRLEELQIPVLNGDRMFQNPPPQLPWDVSEEFGELISLDLLSRKENTMEMMIYFHVHMYPLTLKGRKIFDLATLKTMPPSELKDLTDFCEQLSQAFNDAETMEDYFRRQKAGASSSA
ncbi:MAG: hypothetical protein QM691_01750 [Opitutaceae bacterium]